MTTLRTELLVIAAVILGAGSLPAGPGGKLSAGGYHLLGVNSGQVDGLGDGTYGQLGSNPAGAPATVAGLTGVTQVAAGGFSSIALKSDGTVWFLGETTLQHTTPHGTPNAAASPVQVAGLSGIDALAAGHRHYLALDTDSGDLFAWGHNGSGQVGNGGLLDAAAPVLVLTGVASMAAGDGFSLAVKSDNTVLGWGRNTHGQLGLGDTMDRLTPTPVPGISTALAVAAGGQHSLILLTSGTVLATGNNAFGQLGDGTTTSTSTPTAVPGLGGITTIAAGYHHSAALDSAGEVSLWGRNFEGQCGGGASSPVGFTSPQALTTLPASPTTLACGYHFTVFAFVDGTVRGTGSNSDGQLDGNSVADQDSSQKTLAPQLVPLTLDPAGPDEDPPLPDPMSFAEPPAALNESTITMTATTATDISGPVEYLFENTTNGNTRDWSTSDSWSNTGLTAGLSYDFRVRARDAEMNETGWSAVATAVPAADTTPPAPAPMTFAVAPTALGTSSITMTATTASDVNGVEYFFDCLTIGGHDSPWQDSPTYVDTGLLPNTGYTYRVQARDKSAGRNATGFSSPASATTQSGLLSIEFNQDDQAGFDIWPSAIGGSSTTAVFGATTVTVTTSTGFGTPGNRGSTNGNPAGYSYQHLYEDLLHATTPTGFLTLDFSGLNANANYQFTLYAWDPGASSTSDKEWTVTGGTGMPPAASVNFQDPLVDNDTFAMVFEITTTGTGTFQLVNTAGLDQSAINGFTLMPLGPPTPDYAVWIAGFGLDPADRDFTDDIDRDGLANGIEAWFGTHPGEWSAGLAYVSSDGTTTTFTHPQNPAPPADVSGLYQWSPNLLDWHASGSGPPGGPTVTMVPNPAGTTTTVIVTASEALERLFLRIEVNRN